MTWWMALLKFVHVGAIALWAGGLLVLPLLLARRARLASHDAVQGLHALTRRLVLWFMSPGAFVAVGTGTALIFLRPTQAPWFSAKLAAVGLMAALHVAQSTLVLRLFRPGERVPAWRLVGGRAGQRGGGAADPAAGAGQAGLVAVRLGRRLVQPRCVG